VARHRDREARIGVAAKEELHSASVGEWYRLGLGDVPNWAIEKLDHFDRF